MSQKKTLEKDRLNLRNRVFQLSVEPSSRRLSMQPSSLQPRPSKPSTSFTNKRSQKIIEESIERKLDELLTRQKRLEEQVSDLKELLYAQNTSFSTKDKEFISVIKVFINIYYRFRIYMYMY